MVTIFKNIFAKEPHYISVDAALDRIKTGRSKQQVELIREQISKDRADNLKANLPSVCFSGKFTERKDEMLVDHSGFIVLDFDEVNELRPKQEEIINNDFVYACWVSPRNNGLKALVKIADGKKHRDHFEALKELFPEVDKSGINESRVCYESYDPDIYINREAKPFKKFKKIERVQEKEAVQNDVFDKIVKWLSNRGDAFVTGERNIFIFKLASACCRFGINESECLSECTRAFPVSNTFTEGECVRAIRSAYKSSKNAFGTAQFEKDVLVDRVSRGEVKIDEAIFDPEIKPKDVIFGEDVKQKAINIYQNGYEAIKGIGVPELDDFFKMKEGELTLLSGIGNYGKSTFFHWMVLMRIIKYNERFAMFSPESNPAEEFYHDFTEMILGCDCTPYNPGRPNQEIYEAAYDFVSKRIFFVYPKEMVPEPDYIKERFLELVIKEGVKGIVIDPFNQLSNDYRKAGGRSDKYLETFLSDCIRFANINGLYSTIVAHPHAMKKDADGNYPCPDLFDIADGAMWNNKVDNMLIYHRPNHQKDPQSPMCELHTKKIRRQKTVGKKGVVEFEYFRKARRYFFNGSDNMQKLLNETGMDFMPKQQVLFGEPKWSQFKDNNEMPF